MSKCQNLTLPEQLNTGIRFVDIRCRHYQDKLFLHHGSEYLGVDFNYALKACRDFLKAHPTECIIMSVKEEHVPAENEKSFDEVFTDYVSPFLNLLHYDSNIPKLGDVRGKVVLFRRFYVRPENNTTQWGIDMTAWVSDTTFSWPYGS